MHRYYLTYQFALSFDQLCIGKGRVADSARAMATAFGESIRTKDPREELRMIELAAQMLETCRRRLDEGAAWTPELKTKHLILRTRFAALIAARAGDASATQLELLGKSVS